MNKIKNTVKVPTKEQQQKIWYAGEEQCSEQVSKNTLNCCWAHDTKKVSMSINGEVIQIFIS